MLSLPPLPSFITLPRVCYAVAALLVLSIGLSACRGSSKPVPDQMLADVRAEITAVTSGVSAVGTQVETSNGLLTEICNTLQEIKDLSASGKGRNRSESPVADNSPAAPPLCLRLPSGVDTDLAKITAQATGRFTVQGESYRAALIRHGFAPTEVGALDEATCHRVYDGYRSSQPCSVSQGVSWRTECQGVFCRRVRQ